ncbi:HNH endonuclease [Pseudoalteromonas sp. SWN166]|uniref:HNH endonuclease n=1 Tax=Pseudoalteromonas sp. SWN166 TaxID=2792061 RepID=UPI0018CCDB36|nr:HNH endonuclease [Pseudoalteromonas sp. SWN166]MBH0038819.1 HNH endonuclease [Pseudoalteromonas sp. SWN166]
MTILFCNIGWMQRYEGIDGDNIERGGAYNKTEIGHEVCNFSNVDGTVFGYVQPTGQIKIERLGADKKSSYIEGVTVVWLAGPETGGTAVIGWYKDATVYRDKQKLLQPSKEQSLNGVDTYRVKALWENTVLLPIEKRTLLIPRAVKGGVGQSNVWYADSHDSLVHVTKVKNLINGITEIDETPDIDEEAFGVEGNPRLRAHIARERDSSIIKKKRNKVLAENGFLKCEACDFDFFDVYGEAGKEFCEIHHLIPLHKCDGVIKTELSDLAVVCSNCHRILHRAKPMLSLENLKEILERTK